jgi:uncharacterized protein YdiU (UPF0061 family)
MATYRPAPRHLSLGEPFFDPVDPAKFPKHVLRFRNQRWADRVGLAGLDDAQWQAHFAQFQPLAENLREPLALRYHGHQFDVYNPDLGDGRGFLFAQLLDEHDRLLDLGTKGSGRTPWSRGGDGRLTLKGGVREILATEMLEALGVYTSKTFSLFETGEALMRGDEPSPTRSSVLVRLSHSHVRIGTFQRLAYHADRDALRRLVDYSIAEYVKSASTHVELMAHVTRQSARLCASWMLAGFVHGVLNSDNMTITGESFDYGPWRFLPRYDPAFTAAYFDSGGLYAFGRQPQAVLTNLVRLAKSLSLLGDEQALIDTVRPYEQHFQEEIARQICSRLGIESRGIDDDLMLVEAMFDVHAHHDVGYEHFFFDAFGADADRMRSGPRGDIFKSEQGEAFIRHLSQHKVARRRDDPYFRREDPCTMLIQEVEGIWALIDRNDDWSALEAKVDEIRAMGRALALGDRVSNANLG